MGVMSANFKLFYQCRKLWYWYLALAPAGIVHFVRAFSPDVPGAGAGHFAYYLLPATLIGFFAASLQMEILVKPFAFSLPGHHEVPRRALYRLGWSVSLLYSLTFLVCPAPTISDHFLTVASGALTGMAAYLLGVWAILAPPRVCRGILVLLFTLQIQGLVLLDGASLLESVIVDYSTMTIPISAAIACFSWRKMEGKALARRNFGHPFSWVGGFGDTERVGKPGGTERTHKRAERSRTRDTVLDSFSLSRMDAQAALGRGRYMWGAVYVGVMRPASFGWKPGAFFLVFCTVASGYYAGTPGDAVHGLLFFFLCLIGLDSSMRIHSSMLLAAGRRERFLGGTAAASGIAILVMLVAILAVILAQGLRYALPPLTLRGEEYTYVALGMRYIYLPLLLVPAVLVSQLVIPKRMGFIGIIPFMIVGAAVLAWLPFLHGMGPVSIGFLIVVEWLLVMAVLAYVCFRKDLVTQ